MICLQIVCNGKQQTTLRLNKAEAQRLSEILLVHSMEFKSTGDLKGAMLGTKLKELVDKLGHDS